MQPVWVPVALLVHYACGGASVGGVRGGACGRGRGLAQDLGWALHLPVPGVLVSLALSEQEAMVPLPTSHDVTFTISWRQQQEVWRSHEQLTDANIRSFWHELPVILFVKKINKRFFLSFFLQQAGQNAKGKLEVGHTGSITQTIILQNWPYIREIDVICNELIKWFS